MSDLPAAQQSIHGGADVGFAHQAFADEHGVDACVLQAQRIGAGRIRQRHGQRVRFKFGEIRVRERMVFCQCRERGDGWDESGGGSL